MKDFFCLVMFGLILRYAILTFFFQLHNEDITGLEKQKGVRTVTRKVRLRLSALLKICKLTNLLLCTLIIKKKH